ncbi:MAG: Dihydrolipoyllysine-residue acetyltransferase component of pyruvate dehydrogenase complex [Turneriella sp.]|nr:Dihydrolipoyllysine-residue acetyltransferase component of pyruvate dehydrogenase complex [Turneriella sp.]
MAKIAVMTQLSPTMKEGVFVDWQKSEGDTVKPGDILASIETDKAVMELEAFDGGMLLKKIAAKGDKIPVGGAIGVIGAKDENIENLLKEIQSHTLNPSPLPKTEEQKIIPDAKNANTGPSTLVTPQQLATPSNVTGRTKASPLAKKIAAQEGITLEKIHGSGPGGRIVSRDLVSHQNTTPTPLGTRVPDTRIEITPMRKTIAERLSIAKQTVPHFYLSRTLNATRLLRVRQEINAALANFLPEERLQNGYPEKISVNDFILTAVAQSLKMHPEFLRQWNGDSILKRGNIDVGFAVSLDDGLITPVIRNADVHNLFTTASLARELGNRARARKLKIEEYTDGVFTVTNLGMLAVTSFDAIINTPESAILAVGTNERRPYEGENGGLLFGDFLTLNLACDHRVIDGATGAKFLITLTRFLENPGLIR